MIYRFNIEKNRISREKDVMIFSKNLHVYYCKWCNLNGYATRYLFVNRYRVTASNATRTSFSEEKNRNNAYSLFFEIFLKK